MNYVARMTIEGPGGAAEVQTVWAVSPGEGVPVKQRSQLALHEPVVLVVEKDGYPAGTHGTVVEAYPQAGRYIVEIFDDAGNTLDLVDCLKRELRRR